VLALQASEVGYFDQDEVNLLAELAANVSFALELMHKQDRITYLALYDPLTGLPNRTLFHERLTQSLQSAVRNNTSLALVLIDSSASRRSTTRWGSRPAIASCRRWRSGWGAPRATSTAWRAWEATCSR